MCDAATLGGEGNTCGQDPFIILPSRSKYVDQQQLKLQVHNAIQNACCDGFVMPDQHSISHPACIVYEELALLLAWLTVYSRACAIARDGWHTSELLWLVCWPCCNTE